MLSYSLNIHQCTEVCSLVKMRYIIYTDLINKLVELSLPETNSKFAPENIRFPKRKPDRFPSIHFSRGRLAVSFREGKPHKIRGFQLDSQKKTSFLHSR